jgi:hypothetical protein
LIFGLSTLRVLPVPLATLGTTAQLLLATLELDC